MSQCGKNMMVTKKGTLMVQMTQLQSFKFDYNNASWRGTKTLSHTHLYHRTKSYPMEMRQALKSSVSMAPFFFYRHSPKPCRKIQRQSHWRRLKDIAQDTTLTPTGGEQYNLLRYAEQWRVVVRCTLSKWLKEDRNSFICCWLMPLASRVRIWVSISLMVRAMVVRSSSHPTRMCYWLGEMHT